MKRTIVLFALAVAMVALAATVGAAKAHASTGGIGGFLADSTCPSDTGGTILTDDFTEGEGCDESSLSTSNTVMVCIDGATYTFASDDNPQIIVDYITANFPADVSTVNACAPSAPPAPKHGLDRAGYCVSGVFMNLGLGQPATDPALKDAKPAFYIDGTGLTCDPPGGAFTQAAGELVSSDGTSTGVNAPGDIYPHFKKTG
jgi:hypothetical protein